MNTLPHYPRIEWLVDASAARRPDHLALVYHDRRWTYAVLRAEMNRRAALLIESGLLPGEIVATRLPRTDDMVLNALACFRADLPFLFLSSKLSQAEATSLLERGGVTRMLTPEGDPDPALPDVPALPQALPGAPGANATREALRRSAAGSPDAIAYFKTSSGTTGGIPKLARLTHVNATCHAMHPATWETPDDVYFSPDAGVFGPLAMVIIFGLGATLILSDTLAPARMEAEMAAGGVTVLYTVPPLVHLLAAQATPPPSDLRLRALRTISAPLAPAVAETVARRYGVAVVQQYASAEGGDITRTVTGTPEGSIGKPFPDVTIRIMNDDNADVPEGDIGELIVQSPTLMRDYADDPAATARALRDGWLYTGDLARRDADGFYFLVGRTGLRINVGGYKVHPEEVEAILLSHPGVREVVVLGETDMKRGEVVRAVMVSKGVPPSARELRRYCRDRLASYKVPRHWEFRDALPRSSLGKVLRHLL